MKAKPKIYLDTTVPSALLDDRAPDRLKLTKAFWDRRMSEFDPVVSEIVIKEIRDTPDPAKRDRMEALIEGFQVLILDEEARQLAHEYINNGIFTPKTAPDASHVAIAVTNRIGYLISWNFRHLVKVSTRRGINLVNSVRGFEPIEIISPPEL